MTWDYEHWGACPNSGGKWVIFYPLGREVKHYTSSTPIWVCFDWSSSLMGQYFLLKGQHADCGYTSLGWPTTTIIKIGSCVHYFVSMHHAFFPFFTQM